MNFIDRNGRLFGKISVIDVLVIGVVLVMAAALFFKNNQAHTGLSVTEQDITFQVRARGVDDYVAAAILVGDYRHSGGAHPRHQAGRPAYRRHRCHAGGGQHRGPANHREGPGAGHGAELLHQPGL